MNKLTEMKFSKLLSLLVAAGAIVFSTTVVTAQTAAKTQPSQKGRGIDKLLQHAGATGEQIKQFNDARTELGNVPNYRAGRELPNVTTLYPGELPRIGGGNNHINAEGQIKLGKVTASAIEEFYKASSDSGRQEKLQTTQ